jgi:TPR repeat protein
VIFRGHRVKKSVQRAHRSEPTGVREYNESLQKLESNEAEAFRLNARAAAIWMHDAVLAMGWFYLNGAGVEPDVDEAIRWYKKAARHGEPMAFFSFGQIALERRDYAESIVWLNRAAEKNHARSKYYLGKLYWRGNGIEQDRRLARRLFAEAAASNIVAAQRTERFLAHLGKKQFERDFAIRR